MRIQLGIHAAPFEGFSTERALVDVLQAAKSRTRSRAFHRFVWIKQQMIGRNLSRFGEFNRPPRFKFLVCIFNSRQLVRDKRLRSRPRVSSAIPIVNVQIFPLSSVTLLHKFHRVGFHQTLDRIVRHQQARGRASRLHDWISQFGGKILNVLSRCGGIPLKRSFKSFR